MYVSDYRMNNTKSKYFDKYKDAYESKFDKSYDDIKNEYEKKNFTVKNLIELYGWINNKYLVNKQ